MKSHLDYSDPPGYRPPRTQGCGTLLITLTLLAAVIGAAVLIVRLVRGW